MLRLLCTEGVPCWGFAFLHECLAALVALASGDRKEGAGLEVLKLQDLLSCPGFAVDSFG